MFKQEDGVQSLEEALREGVTKVELEAASGGELLLTLWSGPRRLFATVGGAGDHPEMLRATAWMVALMTGVPKQDDALSSLFERN